MKIKKVEIQAFRAYDNVENGTFDFQRKDGEYADFVSLYAPNGFGKTSFYDAIEYGYTKNIDRFLKNFKINQDSAKSEKNLNKNDKQYILRNKYSHESLSSYVKILVSNSSKPLFREIPVPARKGAADFKFDDKETENRYFREVILSQDWISGFLKESKPEDRYKTFMEYFGDKELDKYYNILKDLIEINSKKIKVLASELNGIQIYLKFDGDKEILNKINNKIDSLNETAIFFTKIDSQSSDFDILNITNDISERLNNIDFEIAGLNEKISSLDNLISGNDQIISFSKYKDDLKILGDALLEQQNLNLTKIIFEDLRKKEAEINSIQIYVRDLKLRTDKKERISGLIEKYDEVRLKIGVKDKEAEEAEDALRKIREDISTKKNKESELELQTNNTQNQITAINEIILEIPEINKKITNSEENIRKNSIELELNSAALIKHGKNVEEIKLYLDDLKKSLSNISNKDYPSEFDINFIKYATVIKEINRIEQELQISNRHFDSIKKDIVEQEKLQTELQNFLSAGLAIVNDSKYERCPLCEHKYESYQVLAEKISNNVLLTKIINDLLSKRNDAQEKINVLTNDLVKDKDKLIKLIEKDISNSELALIDLNRKSLKCKNDLTKLNNDIEKDNGVLIFNKNLLLNKSAEDFIKWTVDEIKKLSAQVEKFIAELNLIRKDIQSATSERENTALKIDLCRKDKTELEEDGAYVEVRDYFKENYPEGEITVTNLDKQIKEDLKRNQEYSDSIKKIEESIAEIQKKLIGFDEEAVNQNLQLVKELINELKIRINLYESNAAKVLDLSFDEIELENYPKIVAVARKENDDKIFKYKEEIKDIKILSDLKDNVVPYLKYEESRQNESVIKKRISILKDKIGKKLTEELKKVSKHIELQIKSFFFEPLINDLYKRIDPHPDYKKVKFIPDFNDSKPKLNVCVYMENAQSNFIIPNLYFSHAQLNILSLCIFLAKALNAKDDSGNSIDCIFVDDPIQSMDSINILSTIDLLRSIVVNQKKQIILSTHDENFHNLLKKKIPASLFKAKYLELETFGKLRMD
ncbi:hypothetical protein NYQ10_20665 [Flavobacterium johnsoniae]|uniref:hypothetical protein n=1 Tax=Flavobacterium TaxID=237 RepID=UPI0015C1932E|nr:MULTISPECIES: hypothetical protein [Flavobacterium]NWL02862.1 hypothetical protein [Flavobacterium collinsii]WET04011.1 hypothetical protein P0R33_06635 [Flavobacterium sp. YJ01]WJS94498.1 hypothetical protein NYQ10_20665 [Flavobacterium johnsoniae]